MNRQVWASSGITVACLLGGPVVSVAISIALFNQVMHVPLFLSSLVGLLVIGAAGALWGWLLARQQGLPRRPLAVSGAISYGPSALLAGLGLSALEKFLVEGHRLPGLQIHVIYTILFVPAVFLVTIAASAAILVESNRRSAWLHSALITGLTGALTFLFVDLLLDAVGYRVGAPHAAEHFTMLTVTALGALSAALTAGAVLGAQLSRSAAALNSQPPISGEPPVLVSPPG